MPWDATATAETAGAYRSAEDKLAGLRGAWDVEQRRIGIGQGYESNPYSQASLLVRQKEIGQRGIVSRPGQLYAGSTINHAGQVERGYSEGRSHLEEAYEAAKAREEREELATQHELASEREQAQAEAVERARESAPEPAPIGAPPGGGGGKRKGGGGKGPGVGKGRKAR